MTCSSFPPHSSKGCLWRTTKLLRQTLSMHGELIALFFPPFILSEQSHSQCKWGNPQFRGSDPASLSRGLCDHNPVIISNRIDDGKSPSADLNRGPLEDFVTVGLSLDDVWCDAWRRHPLTSEPLFFVIAQGIRVVSGWPLFGSTRIDTFARQQRQGLVKCQQLHLDSPFLATDQRTKAETGRG